NTNAFGFWESPIFVVGPFGSSTLSNVVYLSGVASENALYRTTFNVRSDLEDETLVPTVRLRSSSFDFQKTDEITLSSRGNGALSPTTDARNYVQIFDQPESLNMFRLDFDVLNFEPEN